MIAVTGATGHLGLNLVSALTERGDSVRCLVHGPDWMLDPYPVERVHGDVLEPACLERLMDGVSTVFHCAALISTVGDMNGLVRRVNVDGVRNVATAAKAAGVKRFVHVSSCHAFDMRNSVTVEDGPRAGPGLPAYDQSKAAGEAALREVGLDDFVILNPAGLIGPLDFGPGRMGTAFRDLRNRRLPALIDGGFYFVDVRDVVEAMLIAEQRGKHGANYLLGGHYHWIPALFRLAAGICGVPAPRVVMPMALARLGAPVMTAWATLTKQVPLYTKEALDTLLVEDNFDQSRAMQELDFHPRPAKESIEDLYESFDRAASTHPRA